jgi:ribosomal protein S27E
MSSLIVEFFDEDLYCMHCGEITRGIVVEHSAMIRCDQCGDPLFDARGLDGGHVVILELEKEETRH